MNGGGGETQTEMPRERWGSCLSQRVRTKQTRVHIFQNSQLYLLEVGEPEKHHVQPFMCILSNLSYTRLHNTNCLNICFPCQTGLWCCKPKVTDSVVNPSAWIVVHPGLWKNFKCRSKSFAWLFFPHSKQQFFFSLSISYFPPCNSFTLLSFLHLSYFLPTSFLSFCLVFCIPSCFSLFLSLSCLERNCKPV